MSEPICDFCSAQTAPWVLKAQDFTAWQIETFDGCSVGDWAACDTCKALIDTDQREKLLEHSWASLLHDNPWVVTLSQDYRDEMKESIRSSHEGFFKNRKVE